VGDHIFALSKLFLAA